MSMATTMQFVCTTLFIHPHAHALPMAVRLEAARIFALQRPRTADEQTWMDALWDCLKRSEQTNSLDNYPHAVLPTEETAAQVRARSAPKLVAVAGIAILLHKEFCRLPPLILEQLRRIVRMRTDKRTNVHNMWVRDVWHFLFADEPLPSLFDCDGGDYFSVYAAPPPKDVRQLTAEVLAHPYFRELDQGDVKMTLGTARRVVECKVVRTRRREALLRAWRELYQ